MIKSLLFQKNHGILGNIYADEKGVANVDFEVSKGSTLFGRNTLIGRTLVIHANGDEEGNQTDDIDNDGSRLACGIIGRISTPTESSNSGTVGSPGWD